MTSERDGHIHVLPLHVANKIAAGEVVERPASVVKELVENALDAGASRRDVAIAQGGRKLVSVRDDGCGMTRDDALLSLERQATSKILDVDDIERIDTMGFRGEAIPSIASVSRMTITTRRRDADEGVCVQVDAGILSGVRAAGCPPGTLVEVRDLFCNVPARRKFLRACATEEAHVKSVFTVHALAHPGVAFSLSVDGREHSRLAAAESAEDRVRELFGGDFADALVHAEGAAGQVRVHGFVERPSLSAPVRREQFVFVNGRPATAPVIAYAMREAYPRRQGDARPAAILFIELPPSQVDVNVHPAKREVRFRDASSVKAAIMEAVSGALAPKDAPVASGIQVQEAPPPSAQAKNPPHREDGPFSAPPPRPSPAEVAEQVAREPAAAPAAAGRAALCEPRPVEVELPLAPDGDEKARPWAWFKFLATTASGYLLVETDTGVVTINPHAARERIAYEQLRSSCVSQALLIPETVQLSPPDFARLKAASQAMEGMGFKLEPFGRDTFKVDAVPQTIDGLSAASVLATVARDLSEGAGRRGGERWREELVAKSVAKSFAGMSLALTPEGAVKLVEELAACKMPYMCPRGRPIMIFTSTRELDRKFART